jgi:hypothetical protein
MNNRPFKINSPFDVVALAVVILTNGVTLTGEE